MQFKIIITVSVLLLIILSLYLLDSLVPSEGAPDYWDGDAIKDIVEASVRPDEFLIYISGGTERNSVYYRHVFIDVSSEKTGMEIRDAILDAVVSHLELNGKTVISNSAPTPPPSMNIIYSHWLGSGSCSAIVMPAGVDSEDHKVLFFIIE